MEAATHKPPPAATPAEPVAPPKLTIEKFADGGIACLKFVGTIDEGFEGKKLGATASGDVLVIDLGGVKKISSFGIREWIDFVTAAAQHVRSLILIECAPKVVDQLNMVANFAGGGRVFSFYAPFRCDYCDSEQRVVLQVDKDHETIKTMKLAERPCPACKEPMYFDEDGATFFSYILGQERFELEPEVAGFLASKLNYAVDDLNRKLRVDKVIDGRTTYLKLTGDLDRTFPRDKLAEGLEGLVIVDLQSLGRVEPAGAAEWRGFVLMAAPLVEQMYFAAAPPAFLEKLAARGDLGPKAQIVTLTLPYACASCGTTSGQLIDVAQHHDVLKFATAPELRCPTCKHAMQCMAGETLMTVLPDLPKPSAPPELVKSIGMLRERAAHAQPRKASAAGRSMTALAAAPPVAAARSSLAVTVLAALLAVVLAAGGYFADQQLAGDDGEPTRGTRITDRSAPARPDWMLGIDANTCGDAPNRRLSCLGVSWPLASRDEAEDEATDAAYEALADAIVLRIADEAWRLTVPELYVLTRDAKLGARDRAPALTSAQRAVREGRRAVAQALRITGGSAVPATPSNRYWEEQSGPEGTRYVAYAQLAIGATELAKLVEAYRRPASALGATAIDLFPLVAWRHPRLERGAILTALGPGPLLDAGLARGYVVLAVGGRDVADAAAFAQLATEEYAALAARGGTLRLKVQTADPVPREFAAAIKARPEKGEPAPGRRPPRGAPAGSGTGGVNVWDRFGGGKGSGRDDPTQ